MDKQINEPQFILERSAFIKAAKKGEVKGLEIADDISKGGLIISVKGGKYEIDEKESQQMWDNDDDLFESDNA